MKWFSWRCQLLTVTLGHALLSQRRLSFNDSRRSFRLFPHRKHEGDTPSCKHSGRVRLCLIWAWYPTLPEFPWISSRGFLLPVLLAGLLFCHHPCCFREYERHTEKKTITDPLSVHKYNFVLFTFYKMCHKHVFRLSSSSYWSTCSWLHANANFTGFWCT